MPPAVVAGAPRKVIDPSKPGKFSVKIGDSLKDAGSGKKRLTSLKYNHKPSAALNNGRQSTLKSRAGGAGNEVTVEIKPNDATEPTATFAGAQGPSKKTECVLIYDPATGTFTLEKLLSTFTLNLTSADPNAHPLLALPKYNPGQSDDEGASDSGSSDGDPTKADKENPFDYRHFINRKFEVPTSSSRLQNDKNRKQRLEKFHEELEDPNASSSEEDRMEEDHSGDLVIDEHPVIAPPVRSAIPARPKATPTASKPRAKATPKTPATKKSTTAVNGGPLSLTSASRKGAIPTESIDLGPSPVPTPSSRPQAGHKRTRQEESSEESDADNESDESDEDEDAGEPYGSSEFLIVEGEDEDDNRNNRSRSTTAGLGPGWRAQTQLGPISLNAAAARDDEMESDTDEEGEDENGVVAPMSLAGFAAGGHSRLSDESEESSSDEDAEDDPRLNHHQQQQYLQAQSAPTPNGNAEEEEEEEFDSLAGMLEEALDNEEEESESEEE